MCEVLIAFYGRKLNGNSMENVATMSIAIKCCCVAAVACLLQRCLLLINLSFTFFLSPSLGLLLPQLNDFVFCFCFFFYPLRSPSTVFRVIIQFQTMKFICFKQPTRPDVSKETVLIYISKAKQINATNKTDFPRHFSFFGEWRRSRLQCQWQNRFSIAITPLKLMSETTECVYNGSLHRDNI